jgi:hypothetical protein
MSKATYPLKLPVSIKHAAAKLAKEDGVSLNQWIASAVAEKVGAVETAADFFKRRAGKANAKNLLWFLETRPKSRPLGEMRNNKRCSGTSFRHATSNPELPAASQRFTPRTDRQVQPGRACGYRHPRGSLGPGEDGSAGSIGPAGGPNCATRRMEWSPKRRSTDKRTRAW